MTVKLGFSEAEFWAMSLRKLTVIIDEHIRFNSLEKDKKEEDVYIDELFV